MAIGGGVFGEWESSVERAQKITLTKPEFKPAVYEVLRAAGVQAMGWKPLVAAVRDSGVKIADHDARTLLDQWSADPAEPLRKVPSRGYAV